MRASRLCVLNLCSQRCTDYGLSSTIVWKAVFVYKDGSCYTARTLEFHLQKGQCRRGWVYDLSREEGSQALELESESILIEVLACSKRDM